MFLQKTRPKGFSLIELLVVIAIIGILSAVVLASLNQAREEGHLARAKSEFRSLATALELYFSENGFYPADASRSIPPGLEEHLSTDDWPAATWPGSVYDWDAWDVDGDGFVETYQFSIRFCPLGDTDESDCRFPNQEWASDFDSYSSVYYCVEGMCRSHNDQPADHPGYCVNCGG